MGFNWLDVVILVLLLITLILGLIKGFIRQVIGIAAVVGGLVLAAKYYLPFSSVIGRLISVAPWPQLIAFFLLFIGVLVVGWMITFLLSKLIRGPLKFIDHLFGGALGLLKGVLICGVIVFALLVFPVDKNGLVKSSLAPYCYWMTKGVVHIIPKELKEKFRQAYKEMVGERKSHGKEV